METFSVTHQEAPLNLAAQAVNYRTSLIDLFVTNSTELTISATTVPDPNLKDYKPFIGIWKGTDGIGSTSELVGMTSLTFNGGTANSNYTVRLTKPGLNLNTDSFTVGLFLRTDDARSLGASVNLSHGRAYNYQASFIIVMDANNRFLNLFYNVPDTISPVANKYVLFLFKGESFPTNRSSLKSMWLSSKDSSGDVQMPVADIVLPSGPYMVAINPGDSALPLSCAASFKIN